jgi:hypothetical protein
MKGAAKTEADQARLIHFVHQPEKEAAGREPWLQIVKLGFHGAPLTYGRDAPNQINLKEPPSDSTEEHRVSTPRPNGSQRVGHAIVPALRRE